MSDINRRVILLKIQYFSISALVFLIQNIVLYVKPVSFYYEKTILGKMQYKTEYLHFMYNQNDASFCIRHIVCLRRQKTIKIFVLQF